MKNKTGYAIKKTDDEILGALYTILWKRNNILGLKNLFVFLSLLTNCCIFCICMRLTFKIYLQKKPLSITKIQSSFVSGKISRIHFKSLINQL